MDLIKDLFFNLSIITLLMFIFNLWAEKYNTEPLPRVLCGTGLVLSVLVCLLFSTPLYGVMIDMRQIPIIIGGLYYGFGPLLSALSLLFRGLMYGFDSGFWTILPLYITLAIFLYFAHPWFQMQNSKKRLFVSLSALTIMNIFMLCSLLISGLPLEGFKAVAITTLIQYIGICLLFYLIEEMRKNEFFREQMVKAQKIELASHMSAAISHEVRNPLTAVQGFLQLAAEDQNMNEKTRGYIDIALTELTAAELVIKDYLTFAQPAMSKAEKFQASSELNQIIKSLQPMANMNSVEIIQANSDSCYIYGDKSRFRQCFLNIMKNCIEAMPNGGVLTILTKVINNEVKISISDTGIGMTADQINRLGEPYYSTKGKKGTGLGLMVSFSIIREFKGNIKINSKPGKGTEFLVTFPAL
ncbi:histidine kinase [Bacillus sp. M6-12]|uniref:sensor histidine kinase n=1 Tax=Bacillus sp. M6-12 TaxID=2054166 RepID=UPI000C789646|nr:HAMP domain-containing sensor histidine kinase [Bacillus sp. M6-12]PLS17485.1 histidine kinase [Bacillus sp. M6-12]